MKSTTCFIVIFAMLFLGCKSLVRVPSATPMVQLPEVNRPETLVFGADDDSLSTERGIEVEIVYESDVTHGILEEPGLRFSASGLFDHYTAGLGRFYVFGQYVLVKHVWPDKNKHPLLTVTFLPTGPDRVQPSWDETVSLVVEEVKKRGIGFSGYASDGDHFGEKITVYFELLEQAHLLRVVVDRFTNEMVFGVYNYFNHEQMDPDVWLQSAKRIHRGVEVIDGQLHPIAHQFLRACLDSEIDMRVVQDEDGKRTPKDIPYCVNSILDEFPMGALEIHLKSRFDATYVPEFHSGKYVGEVTEMKVEWSHRLFQLDIDDPALLQEIRRQIRKTYDLLIACGRQVTPEENARWLRFQILPTGAVEINSNEIFSPSRECFTEVLTNRWKFAPRQEDVHEGFGLLNLDHVPK